jgi:guanylate kinase
MPKIIFLMGVAGSGKTTVLHESWLLNLPNFVYVPSFTTRPMREWEINGEKYHHITPSEFQSKIDNDDFLECAVVHQIAMYWTDYTTITAPLLEWKNSIKELEMFWLIAIEESQKIDGQYITIFLDIPLGLMTERIQQRQTISEDELHKRIASATFEKEQAQIRCHHVIDATQSIEKVCEEVRKICLTVE